MAQQFIKIFDDTVLKQSVNQGYEVQRTNTRLGKFTMGELAFTRDTARLFVGNFTNNTQFKDGIQIDSTAITGGSLVGNKYLGFIDSKPLTHWSIANTENTNAYLPLSYTQDTTTEYTENVNGDSVTRVQTEKALLLTGSKFRNDDNGGWSKTATYNEKYDAYNGDYLYDAYNNALIIFDNNIKVTPVDAPLNWKMNNGIQQFINEEGTVYTEQDGDYSKFRTRFHNAEQPTSDDTSIIGNKNYPIYGDGYVVFRLLEPDNITIGYKEKSYNQAYGTEENNNYSHNYLTLKSVPIQFIKPLFDENYIDYTENKQKLTFKGASLDITQISGDNLTLPKTVSFGEVITITFSPAFYSPNDNDKLLVLQPSVANSYTGYVADYPRITVVTNGNSISKKIIPGTESIFDLSVENTEDETVDQNFYNVRDVFIIDECIWNDETKTISQPKSEIQYGGNVIYDAEGIKIANEQVPSIKKITQEDVTADQEADGDKIYDEGDIGKFRAKYTTNGSLFILYDSAGEDANYIPKIENGKLIGFKGNFEHPYVSTGLNYLKDPEPIAWGGAYASSSTNQEGETTITNSNTASWAQFFIHPFIISPHSKYRSSSNITTIGSSLTNDFDWFENGEKWSHELFKYVEGVKQDENGEDITYNTNTNFDNLSKALQDGYLGVRIPDHATSVICEIHILPAYNNGSRLVPTNGSCLVTTNADYRSYTVKNVKKSPPSSTDFNLFTDAHFSNPPIINEPELDSYKYVTRLASSSYAVQQFELPLYRDANAMKFFSFHINTLNCKFIIRAIGYRA